MLPSLLATILIASNSFAAIPCASEIKRLAVEKAESEGFFQCGVGEPRLSAAVELRGEYGSVGLICQRHISQVSVASEPISYLFSAGAGDCSSVVITDLQS